MCCVVFGFFISETATSLRKDRLTYLKTKKLMHIERELARLSSDDVKGDFVEFGVALGGSGILLAKNMPDTSRFHGFDVFEMIPAPVSEKDDDKSRRRYEKIKSGKSKGLRSDQYYGYRKDLFAEVQKSFARYQVPVDQKRVSLHKGLFEDTWPGVTGEINSIAFAHIDCDWYDPVKFCLNAVADKIAPGGVIVMDDYNDYGGCRTATNEFLSERPKYKISRNYGNLIIRC